LREDYYGSTWEEYYGKYTTFYCKNCIVTHEDFNKLQNLIADDIQIILKKLALEENCGVSIMDIEHEELDSIQYTIESWSYSLPTPSLPHEYYEFFPDENHTQFEIDGVVLIDEKSTNDMLRKLVATEKEDIFHLDTVNEDELFYYFVFLRDSFRDNIEFHDNNES